MTKKELSQYFGKDFQTNPQLIGLDANQKSNFSIITKKAKERGITSNYAIAGLLGIVSKESAFKATTEGSYRKTKAPRVRNIFGSKRTSKYTDKDIESFTQDDNKFFDFVYGYIAKSNDFNTLGNDNPGDGFRYRGRGFNQLTFKNIYKDRGKGAGLDLVNKPELLEQPDQAASVLIEYYLNAFSSLSKDVAQKAGITKQQNSLATINSITSVETAVDMFYLATAGNMVMSNYNKTILKYKSGSFANTDGTLSFPNDDLGGYTKARNRAPYFYQIVTGNKLPDTLPTSNPPGDNEDKEDPSEQRPSDTIEQSSSGDGGEGSRPDQKNEDFNPVQLTQVFPPTIKPIPITLDAQTTNKRQRKDFLVGLGTAPFVYYNGIHIEYKDMSYFELYHEGILPAIKITFIDRNGIFKDNGFPVDDTTISIFIYSRSKRLRSINMDFKISNFRDLGQNEFTIMGIANIPEIFLRKFKSYSKKTSFEALKDLAKECELGFCSNIANTKDKMTWINTGFPNYQFIDSVVKNSYLSDDAFLNCYIDFYYNLCYVDVEKELTRNNELDKMVISDGKNEFSNDPEQDEDIAPLILSTDYSAKGTNAFISEYVVTNRSTQVSLNKAYLTKTKFYDTKSKELLIFDVDSITSQGDKTIIMKGKPGDENFFKNNVSNIWVGKLDNFDDEGNAHGNFNYSLIQNQINIDEISKISIDIKIPTPNFNLYILEKIYLALIKQKPGLNQSSLRYKRLVGNWLSTSISFVFDGSSFFQKVNLIKRELEMDEYEKEASASDQSQNKNNTEDFQDNQNELSPNDTPSPTPVPEENKLTSDTVPPPDKNIYNLEYIVGHSMKDNNGLLRTLVVINNQPVDEKVGIAFLQMQEAAKKEGISLVVNSGFRPAFGPNFKGKTSKDRQINITTQETLRRDRSRWNLSERAKFQTDEEFILKAPSRAFNPQTAPPGKSNHGNGIALDLNSGSRKAFGGVLIDKNYIWLIRNSWKFGFVRAVQTEEWHFEYKPEISKKGPYADFAGGDKNLYYSDLGLDKLNLV